MEEEIKLVIVEWLDACHVPGWHNADDIAKLSLAPMKTAGWLIRHDSTVTVVAMTMSEFKAGDVLCIPTECITDMYARTG